MSEQALDHPDSAGWWAWEGYINYANGGIAYDKPEREVMRVFWGATTGAWQVMRERGRHPAKMLIGKWTRLHMPWEDQPRQVEGDWYLLECKPFVNAPYLRMVKEGRVVGDQIDSLGAPLATWESWGYKVSPVTVLYREEK